MFQNFPSTGLVSQFFTVTFSLQNFILVSPVVARLCCGVGGVMLRLE